MSARLKFLCVLQAGARVALSGFFLGLLPTASQANQVVLFKHGTELVEVGQGFLVSHLSECKIILPTHVAQDGAKHFRLVGNRPVVGSLSQLIDLGDDVSIESVRGLTVRQCGHPLSLFSRDVDSAIRQSGRIVLRLVNGDGTSRDLAVSVIDNDHTEFLRVQPINPRGSISKGMSGALLYADRTVVGMLLNVNGRSGVGTVLRYDQIISKVESYLRRADAVAQSGLVTGFGYLKLAAWNAATVGEYPPEIVTSNEESDHVWNSRYDGSPIVLDFELATPDNKLSAIHFDARSVPAAERPEVVELLLRSNKNSERWVSVKTSDLHYENDIATVTISPRRGYMIRARLTKRPESFSRNSESLSLRRVSVTP